MRTLGENALSAALATGSDIRQIEPGIYSVISDIQASNDYDSSFGYIYDWVACNPVYNRLIWGYSVSRFATIAHDALTSSKSGSVLDLGCGSLAFTARTYIQHSDRPLVLLDQSLKMLRIARNRLIKLNGKVPDNMVLLHANALRPHFRGNSFNAIISQNLLHCIDDTKKLLAGLKNILAEDGRMYFTTLIKTNRLADKYLQALADGGKIIPRKIEDHCAAFDQQGMAIEYDISGNMVFIYYRK